MKLIEVKSERDRKEFLRLPLRIYKNYPNWIRPLDKDIEAVFDTEKNKFFRHGDCVRWILQNEQGKTIGRIAAFYSSKNANKDNKQPTGGIGFYESIDDQHAADALFDRAKEWLQSKGMEAMDGPINFGERDRFWGLLIEGFDIDPNYLCNYTPPYYQALFENYGFKLYFNQITFGRPIRKKLSNKILDKAERIKQEPKYHFEHIKKSRIEKYTQDFLTIYNQAWGSHKGVAKLSIRQANAIMKSIKPVMDEKLIWFGYYNNEPIAFFLMLPEVNQIFKYVNGKLDIVGKLKFLYHKMLNTNKKVTGTAFGIVPAHQGKGLEGALIMAAGELVQGKYGRHYDDIEMNWIGDFNPRMIHVCEQIDAVPVKTHRTYRYLFDTSLPVERHPIIGEKKKKKDKIDKDA
ncbi:MAG: hypothetical protein MI784_17930 [Cytophagales bacterium]|nr:hypothetical protein [Cytophagales bacterium]